MVDSKLCNHWVFTGKENNGIRVYRAKKAASDNTQQIENEDSFEIKDNGEFIKYMMSPDGMSKQLVGRYEIEGNTLYARFKNHYLDSMFTIEALDENNVLKIR
jgi:Lipocalin-like domain